MGNHAQRPFVLGTIEFPEHTHKVILLRASDERPRAEYFNRDRHPCDPSPGMYRVERRADGGAWATATTADELRTLLFAVRFATGRAPDVRGEDLLALLGTDDPVRDFIDAYCLWSRAHTAFRHAIGASGKYIDTVTNFRRRSWGFAGEAGADGHRVFVIASAEEPTHEDLQTAHSIHRIDGVTVLMSQTAPDRWCAAFVDDGMRDDARAEATAMRLFTLDSIAGSGARDA